MYNNNNGNGNGNQNGNVNSNSHKSENINENIIKKKNEDGNEDQNEIESMTDVQIQEWTVTDDRAVLAYSLITGEVKYDVMYVQLYYTVSDCYAPLVNWFTI